MFYRLLHYGQKIRGGGQHFIKRILRIIFGCDINLNAKIDKTVKFSHNALGVVVHQNCVIGSDTQIECHVVLGEKQSAPGQAPKIGSNVHIGAGAILLGGIQIGDNSWIGAGAVVLKDIEQNSVAVGVPAKVVKKII